MKIEHLEEVQDLITRRQQLAESKKTLNEAKIIIVTVERVYHQRESIYDEDLVAELKVIFDKHFARRFEVIDGDLNALGVTLEK
jgi:hypothetical protein